MAFVSGPKNFSEGWRIIDSYHSENALDRLGAVACFETRDRNPLSTDETAKKIGKVVFVRYHVFLSNNIWPKGVWPTGVWPTDIWLTVV